MGKRFWSSKGGSLQGGFNSVNWKAPNRMPFNRAPSYCKQNPCSWRVVRGSKEEKNKDRVTQKSWRDVVLVYSYSALPSWRSLQLGLSRMFNVQRVLTMLAADRAVLWCVN